MKKLKKLQLSKDTLVHLDPDKVREVRGGANTYEDCGGWSWQQVSSCAIPCPEH